YAHGRPKIEMLGAPNQVDAYTLRFTIKFLDTGRDLGDGTVHVVIDGTETASLMISDVFSQQSPPVPPDTEEGSFDIIVTLSPTVKVGQIVRIGFYLVDAKGNRSNVPDVVLQATMTGG